LAEILTEFVRGGGSSCAHPDKQKENSVRKRKVLHSRKLHESHKKRSWGGISRERVGWGC